jgi:hypothetical protein
MYELIILIVGVIVLVYLIASHPTKYGRSLITQHNMAFPDTPEHDQEITIRNVKYKYDSLRSVWVGVPIEELIKSAQTECCTITDISNISKTPRINKIHFSRYDSLLLERKVLKNKHTSLIK